MPYRGAGINLQDKMGYSALHFASQNNCLEAVQLLLDSGANVDLEDSFGNTPLGRAVFTSEGKGDVIQLLLRNGADKDHKNKHRISPLDLAQKISNYDVAKYMI
jgi:ankyrin repeat protein